MAINIHHYPKAVRQSEGTASLRRIYIAPQLAGAAVTGLGSGGSWASTEIQVSVNGGTFANYAGTMTELTAGMYSYELTAGEISNAGSLCIKLVKTGIDNTFVIVPVIVWNLNDVTNGLPNVNVGIVSNDAISATAIANNAIDAATFATGAITGAAKGHVIAAVSGTGSATTFVTTLTSAVDNIYKDAFIKITSGTLQNACKRISAYNGTTKAITVESAFPSTPANAVTFEIIND